MRYIIRKSIIDVVGHIWQPGVGPCSYQYTLTPEDVENLRGRHAGKITRSDVEQWLLGHSGDFSAIIDFRASLEVGRGTLDFPFLTADGEEMYYQTFPDGD